MMIQLPFMHRCVYERVCVCVGFVLNRNYSLHLIFYSLVLVLYFYVVDKLISVNSG